MIPYGRQTISNGDISAVTEVLHSDFLTQGPCVPRFEAELCRITGAKFGVAVNSATSALHIACLALDLGPGDVLWTSPITFVASANCALYCGAEVDFVDIDPNTWTMCPVALSRKIKTYKNEGRKLPKIVVPVHLSGQSANMEEIRRITEHYGIRVIEDASHAIGATYQNAPVGSCSFSDVTIFSFHPVKIVTTGEGGAALTNDPSIARRMQLLRSHGITREKNEMHGISDGDWYYEQISLGFNYRMTDISAALGLSQLAKIDHFLARRNAIAKRYDSFFLNLGVQTQTLPSGYQSARHLYVIRVSAEKHTNVFNSLRSSGIGVNLHYIPVYRQPFYQSFGYEKAFFPEAERYYAEAISLPIYPDLTDVQQTYICCTVQSLVKNLN